MIVQIDEDRRIVGAEYAWQLEKRQFVKGESRWRPTKFFPTLRLAVHTAVHDEIRQHPAENLAEAIEAVDSVVRKFERLVDVALGPVADRANS